MIEKIMAWRTSDDQLFEDEASAENHQQVIDFKKAITDWVDNNCWNNMDKDEITGVIIDYRVSLWGILNNHKGG